MLSQALPDTNLSLTIKQTLRARCSGAAVLAKKYGSSHPKPRTLPISARHIFDRRISVRARVGRERIGAGSEPTASRTSASE